MAETATGTVLAIAPTAGLDGPVVLGTEALSRWWNFEAKQATLGAITRPPPPTQDRKPVFLAKSFAGRWDFPGSIALAAAGGAMASTPVARPDRLAVNLAQAFLVRTWSFAYSFSCAHVLSIT
jgi:hypothetical protein